MTTTQQRMAIIFDEWRKRWIEDPKDYIPLEEDGDPKTYGENCARFFEELANELDEKGLLPKPEKVENQWTVQ